MKIIKTIMIFALSFFMVSSPALAVEIGPRPTHDSINKQGTFETASSPVEKKQVDKVFADNNWGTSNFQGGTIYYPTMTPPDNEHKYSVIAILPGATGEKIYIDNFAQRLAKFGFVTIAMTATQNAVTENTREQELLDALKYVEYDATVKNKIEPTRKAAAGYSKGGGETLLACKKDLTLKAGIGLAPWYPSDLIDLSSVNIPQLIIGAELESLAMRDKHAERIHDKLPSTTKNAYAVLKNASHYSVPTDERITYLIVAWAKFFVDGDTRYLRFLCGDDAMEYQSRSDYFTEYYHNCAASHYDECSCVYN